jgi:competence protein ComEA
MRVRHAAALLGLATMPVTAADDPADQATFEKVCGACHASTMVSDLRTEPEWVETVDHMIDVGAKGTREDFGRVLRYLAKNLTKVNVNAATAAQIAPVLDVSEVVAQAVVDYRARHGNFGSIEDLKKVPGLDAGKVEGRRERIAFR